ncbi:HlyD family efflux transporter periplasmic adaptor subunit [Heliobacterium undosum]|uniref:HlyD family efflux transporter periplasmic adaptor subunit n=1 Tax=Heliomicrobium undosum TaxID=121734 RepID=A0A845L3A6_9FIRM|nr:HlyD family efflux transporter periplasmic adaptor subunit [Heliomicrobium undosum]MZP31102.1 HlyD family efflux transporter periplasmic adaptor subunit [Heliomicrobium undosum]
MKAKKLIVFIIGGYLLAAALISAYYGYEHVYFVQTDDAKVAVDLAVARAPIAGHITDLKIRENETVVKDDILAVVEGSPAPNQPKLRAPVFVPSSGQVLRLDAREGEAVTAGQPLVAVADREAAYVEARFEEVDSSRIRVGQTVDVKLDGAAGRVFPGIVSSINRNTEQITWPIISLTPAQQHPKEDQLLNVKIEVPGAPLIPGTGASVKIRVKE